MKTKSRKSLKEFNFISKRSFNKCEHKNTIGSFHHFEQIDKGSSEYFFWMKILSEFSIILLICSLTFDESFFPFDGYE
jgi:hypothetical protein